MAGKQMVKSDAEMQINFSALKKHDENIQHIIDTASSVAHYRFNSTSGLWEKTEVEGTLFLYARKTSPYVIIFIMNRLSKENAKLVLTCDMEYKVQEPFLLCKASNNEIIGIWFYDPTECRHFGALLNRFSSLSKDEKSLQIAIMMDAQKKEKVHDSKNGIMKMFTQAQHEYSDSRSKFMQRQQICNKNNHMPLDKEHKFINQRTSAPNLRPSSASPADEIKPYDEKPYIYCNSLSKEDKLNEQREKFKNEHRKEQQILFNILHGGKGRSRTVSSGHEFDTTPDLSRSKALRSDAGDLAMLNELSIIREQHLISNSSVKEKAIDCAELELQFIRKKSNSMINQTKELDKFNTRSSELDIAKTTNAIPSANFDAIPAPHSAIQNPKNVYFGISNSATSVCGSSNTTSMTEPSMYSSIRSPINTSSDLSGHLLSPHFMTSSKGRGTTIGAIVNGQHNVSLAANFKTVGKTNKKSAAENPKQEKVVKNRFPEAPSVAAMNSLMSPAAFQTTSSIVNKADGNCEINELLTKERFQNILLEMIQTDNDFVTKLHGAFLEQLRKR